MSNSTNKTVVIVGIGSIAAKITARVWKNSDNFNALTLSFMGVSLDKDADKVGRPGPDMQNSPKPKAPFFETWWDEEIKGLPGVGQKLFKKADIVLVLTTGEPQCCKAVSQFMRQLEKSGKRSTLLTTEYFGLKYLNLVLWQPIEVKSRAYRKMAMDQMKDFYKRALREDSTNKKRLEQEEWKWLAMVEGALQAMCVTEESPEGSNLFEEIFKTIVPLWFCCGSTSGNDRDVQVIEQVVNRLIEDEVFMSDVYDSKRCKAFLCLMADDLSEEELHTIKAGVELNFIPSKFVMSVVKTHNPEGVLNFSTFYG